MNNYDKSLQKLTAALKARETFLKSYKYEETTKAGETYDKLAALAALDFVKAYKARENSPKMVAGTYDED